MRLAATIGLGLAVASCTTSPPEPAPTPRGLVPPTLPAPSPDPGARSPDAAQLQLIETQPSAAVLALAPNDRADAPIGMRLALAIARWSATAASTPAATYLEARGFDATQPPTAAALLDLTGRAIDCDAIGVASATFGTWLGAQPVGPALSTEGRSDATRLHAALIDHEAADLAESLVTATLRHDPEDGELAHAYVATLLADGIIGFLRAHASASWAPPIARELPTLATVGDLDDDAMLEQLATTMVDLGGVDAAAAHAQLRAARDLPR